VANTASGPADTLAGSFALSGSDAFSLSGFSAFSSIAAGESIGGFFVTLSNEAPGSVAETITLDPTGYDSAFSGALAPLSLVLEAENAECFRRGTHISTPAGEVAVERLAAGNLVRTLHGGAQPIQWIGRRSYDGRFIAGQHLKLPVRIRRGALGGGLPVRDLWVSPGHGLWIGGVLVPAWRLINGRSITQPAACQRVDYYHIELAGHEVLFAEGCPAESYLNENGRMQFQNHAEYDGDETDAAGLPRLESGFALAALQQRLGAAPGAALGRLRGYVDEAGPLRVTGWAQDEAAPEAPVSLDILAGGRRIARVLANQYRADLRKAGLGSGCHAFEVALPQELGLPITVRRAQDGAELGCAWQERKKAVAF